MVKEIDRDMQQLYHKTCGFCEVFCGNSWCPIIDINKESKKRKEKMSEKSKDYMDFVKENWAGDPIGDDALGHAIVGLCVEAGELANIYKKGRFYPAKGLSREDIMDELGDVLYYVYAIAHCAQLDMDYVALCNKVKLKERNKSDK